MAESKPAAPDAQPPTRTNLFYPLSGRERALVAAAYNDLADIFDDGREDRLPRFDLDEVRTFLRHRATGILDRLDAEGYHDTAVAR